jgi:hypothetical protein
VTLDTLDVDLDGLDAEGRLANRSEKPHVYTVAHESPCVNT